MFLMTSGDVGKRRIEKQEENEEKGMHVKNERKIREKCKKIHTFSPTLLYLVCDTTLGHTGVLLQCHLAAEGQVQTVKDVISSKWTEQHFEGSPNAGSKLRHSKEGFKLCGVL